MTEFSHFLFLFHQDAKNFSKKENAGFNHQKWKYYNVKIARFLYIWFSVCSQKILNDDQRFILLYLVSQIWLNLPTDHNRHPFLTSLLWMIRCIKKSLASKRDDICPSVQFVENILEVSRWGFIHWSVERSMIFICRLAWMNSCLGG